MKSITVFTPTYNREKLLPILYSGLCAQSSKDFVWLIIDDGSADGTGELVKKWQEENIIEIKYVYKKNGGMHTAHNMAYRMIDTELNVCVDSDDSMPPDAIESILSFWGGVDDKEKVSGIIALDSDFDGKVIGSFLPETNERITLEKLVKSHGVTGDKKFIYRTSVMREMPEYPEYEGEKLVPLSYKYWLADREYPFAVMNKVVCLVNYQPDGSTGTIKKQYFESPRGFMVFKREQMIYPRIFERRFKSAIHYVCFNKILGEKGYLKNSPKKLLTAAALPLGLLYYKKMLKTKKEKL